MTPERAREVIDNATNAYIELLKDTARMRSALETIAARRADLAAASKNDYDSGYALATEMCCDIADEALNPPA